MRFAKSFFVSAIAGIGLLSGGGTAHAAPLTYQYTGNPFTTVGDPTLGTSITATVTFDSTVTEGYTGSAGITDFSITAGTLTLTPANSMLSAASFSLVNGSIDFWYLQDIFNGLTIDTEMRRFILQSHPIIESEDFIGPSSADQINSNASDPGTWSEVKTDVPTPGGFALFGIGLVGLAGLAAHRRVPRRI